MKFIYPAIFTHASQGGYTAVFPDLATCTAEGGTLEEAIENANHAASEWISLELSEEAPLMPSVSDLEDLTLEPGQIVRNICVNIRFFEGWDE